jgi:hypothetical protein
MSTFILHDQYFDPDAGRISSYFCQLFILVGQESLQYCILDTEKNTFNALADYRLPATAKSPEMFYTELDSMMAEEERLVKKYPSVIVGLDTPWHTLVPSALYDSSQLTKYLEFNFSLPEHCQVKTDRVEEIDAYNIYGFPQGLKNVILKHYGDAALVHRSSALIRALYRQHQINADPSSVYVNVRDEYIDITCFEGNRLAFFNSFPCRSKEDILYFALYAIGQLKLRPDAVRLYLSGKADAGSDLYLLLEQYMSPVSFTGGLNSFNYSPFLSQLPSHRYQDLFALALCGS